MNEPNPTPLRLEWSQSETRLRQERAGLEMSPAERLAWLDEMLDELLPLVGRARAAERTDTEPHA